MERSRSVDVRVIERRPPTSANDAVSSAAAGPCCGCGWFDAGDLAKPLSDECRELLFAVLEEEGEESCSSLCIKLPTSKKDIFLGVAGSLTALTDCSSVLKSGFRSVDESVETEDTSFATSRLALTPCSADGEGQGGGTGLGAAEVIEDFRDCRSGARHMPKSPTRSESLPQ